MEKVFNPYIQSTKTLSIIAIVFAAINLLCFIPAVIVIGQGAVIIASFDFDAIVAEMMNNPEMIAAMNQYGIVMPDLTELIGAFKAAMLLVVNFMIIVAAFYAVSACVALAGAILGIVNAKQPSKLKAAKILDIVGAVLTFLTCQIALFVVIVACATQAAAAKKFEDMTPKFDA